MPYLGPEFVVKAPKRVQISQNPLYKIQIQIYSQKDKPPQNSNPYQSTSKNTPQNSDPKFI